MSHRWSGHVNSGGRKGKMMNKNKQGRGGTSSASSLASCNGPLPPDDRHNSQLPSCRLLQDFCQELWIMDDDHQQNRVAAVPSSSSSSSSSSWTMQQQQPSKQGERPTSVLGHMLRNHLLEQRRNQVAAAAMTAATAAAATTTTTTAKTTTQVANSNSTATTTTTILDDASSPNKKKKKKKKKKTTNATTPTSTSGEHGTTNGSNDTALHQQQQPETDETDSTAAVSSSVSQDSQSNVEMIKDESKTSSSSKVAVTMNASRHSTNSTATTTTTTTINGGMIVASPPRVVPLAASAAAAWTTPVDAYLDRLLLRQQQLDQEQDLLNTADSNSNSNANSNSHHRETTTSSSSSSSSSMRTLQAFVKYLNDKYATQGPVKSGLSITHHELEIACKTISCTPCRSAMEAILQQHKTRQQPLVLGGITFDTHDEEDESLAHNHNSNNHYHGLAIPVHDPHRNITQEPTPSIDFDYVALEEGTNNVTTGSWRMMSTNETDLRGVPYFHPQFMASAVTAAELALNSSNILETTTNNNNNNHHKQQNPNKGPFNSTNNNNNKADDSMVVAPSASTSRSKQPIQLEWRFVSSSTSSKSTVDHKHKGGLTTNHNHDTRATNNSSETTCQANDQTMEDPPSMAITVEDVEHIVKSLMLPLSITPDELLGTFTQLTEEETAPLIERIRKLDSELNEEIYTSKTEFAKHWEKLQLIQEDPLVDGGVAMKVSTEYLDYDREFQNIMNDIVSESVWDRMLWLRGDGDMQAIRTTESWWNMVAYMTEICTKSILQMMQAVEDFEADLEEHVADRNGKVPPMCVSKSHRIAFRKMLDRKGTILKHLLDAVHQASIQNEKAWPIAPRNHSSWNHNGYELPQQDMRNMNALDVPFRRKWITQQEFCRLVVAHQNREKRARKAGANAKSKKDELQKHKIASSNTSPTQIGAHDKRIQKLDCTSDDLLRALSELSRYEALERLSEIKEERLCRCEKTLGLLARIADEVFIPYADMNRTPSPATTFALQDENLMNECRVLSSQIKQQQKLQKQQHLLGEEPSIVEQRRSVANMTVASIRLIRHLRRCVTDSHELKNPAPIIPLKVVAWLNNYPHQRAGQPNKYHVDDMRHCSYETLLNAALVHQKWEGRACGGGSALVRLTSLLLALFYGKLSEQCSMWRAELAEQELLTNITETDLANHGGGINGDSSSGSKKDGASTRNGFAANATTQVTPGKAKKKKKPKEKKTNSPQSPGEADNVSVKDTAASRRAVDNSDPSSLEPQPSPSVDDGTVAMNSHQEAVGPTNEIGTLETGAKPNLGSQVNENNENCKEAFSASETITTGLDAADQVIGDDLGNKECSFVEAEADKRMGVKDYTGVFQSAESYLVGRLSAIFKAAEQDNSSVIIV